MYSNISLFQNHLFTEHETFIVHSFKTSIYLAHYLAPSIDSSICWALSMHYIAVMFFKGSAFTCSTLASVHFPLFSAHYCIREILESNNRYLFTDRTTESFFACHLKPKIFNALLTTNIILKITCDGILGFEIHFN